MAVVVPPADLPPLRAVLFDVEGGGERHLDLVELESLEVGPGQMLWVDLCGAGDDLVADVWRALRLPECHLAGNGHPALARLGTRFALRVVSVRGSPAAGFEGDVLDVCAGDNVVVTSHAAPLAFLEELRGGVDAGRGGRGELGRLSAESFAATVLDAQLSTYFDAVSAFEMAVERLEMEIFDDRRQECLGELRELRRAASRLRRMLAPHRTVFASLSRPDFRPDEGAQADRHFRSLDVRFERAMDMVENCRDLVMGSFDLFSNQTALRMNRTMYVLTFATVVLGLMAVVVGAFGMNFATRLFDAEFGFSLTVGALALLGVSALLFARWRRWF
ncbi:magnesium transporter CorA family protein [Arenimonas composti]|uniref:Magnesium transporter CorA n=1 Tax=Arenimonas composti TR7-09 = DSM 18010 TaxID=1121013 RepID=A0A091BEK6_9GAMM|nr:CorA family divalent cation transporter [Arenimonas composti]KFN50176.1 hypothetical protein P873_08025 [Arenimonas composti TR7-09 = DSM 18010]